MKKGLNAIITLVLFMTCPLASANEDTRQLVELPVPMQQHMMRNMRDHLETINQIISYISSGQFDQAADIAESRLGMSSLESHGASHMASFMPKDMQQAGTRMHRAASRFALIAQEGDVTATIRALGEVTSSCIACHAAYRIR